MGTRGCHLVVIAQATPTKDSFTGRNLLLDPTVLRKEVLLVKFTNDVHNRLYPLNELFSSSRRRDPVWSNGIVTGSPIQPTFNTVKRSTKGTNDSRRKSLGPTPADGGQLGVDQPEWRLHDDPRH